MGFNSRRQPVRLRCRKKTIGWIQPDSSSRKFIGFKNQDANGYALGTRTLHPSIQRLWLEDKRKDQGIERYK
jgi:hypothetical protein